MTSPYYKLQTESQSGLCNWDETISYNQGDLVIHNYVVYKSIINNNKGHHPEGSTKWVSIL